MTHFENEFLFQCVLQGKLRGNGIETPEEVESRLWSFHKELENNKNNVLFGHAGVFAIIMKKMDIRNHGLNNCGILTFFCNEEGEPEEIFGLCNNFDSV